MISKVNNTYLFVISFFAFLVYQGVNFVYFPIDIVFPDEIRFINRAILFTNTFTFGVANGTATAWEMPFTSILFALFYKIGGSESNLIIITRVFQSLLLILQAILLYKISIKIFADKLSAFLTFIVVLFYPYFIYYQGLLLSETLFNTSLIISFYFIYSWYEKGFKIDRNFILSNIFLIISIYIKATLSFLVPVLLASFYFINKYNIKYTLKIFLYSFIIYILSMSFWWVRNYSIFDEFVAFTNTSAYNLYLGNNPYNRYGGCDWGSDVDKKVVKRISKIPSEVQKNKEYKKEAIEFIKENPYRFIQLAFLKLQRFYSIVPNADGFNGGYYKWISIFSYGIIFILFLFSVLYHMKEYKKLSAIYILFVYFTLIHMLVIASLRYRLPLEPFMILLSMPLLSKIFIYIKNKF
jgi:hypothetical protein